MSSRSLDLNPMDFFFLWKHMKEQRDAVRIRTTEDLLAKYQVAVTTDASTVLETWTDCLAAVRRLPSREQGPFRTPTTLRVANFSFGTLCHLTVTCISKAMRLRTNVG